MNKETICMTHCYNFSVKTYSDLKSMFTSNENTQLVDLIENAILIDGYKLCTYYPARYSDSNKQALFNELIYKNRYEPTKKDILITRFHPKQLPCTYSRDEHNDSTKTYEFIANIFDYKPMNEKNFVEWHMNFANYDIFSYYQSSLLAQDELQVLECPQLASLREYLLEQPNNKERFNTHVIENNIPYPILITNIERVLELDTTNLYGNKFSSSSKSTVLSSYKYLSLRQTVNIIAIEAPKYGRGPYTISEITYILQACYTAYSSAKRLDKLTFSLNHRLNTNSQLQTCIHTGWFGCGAYGGNRTIMIILQVLAAKLAGIDRLIFHTVTSDYADEQRQATEFLQNLFSENQTHISIDDLIEKIRQENFQWGVSDGT